jgi:hypothetical protein
MPVLRSNLEGEGELEELVDGVGYQVAIRDSKSTSLEKVSLWSASLWSRTYGAEIILKIDNH